LYCLAGSNRTKLQTFGWSAYGLKAAAASELPPRLEAGRELRTLQRTALLTGFGALIFAGIAW
jgi:hypothetical protein